MKRVGIFGGTFNPIHAGHVKAAYEFFAAAKLDQLIVIPAGIPPHKAITKGDDPETRLYMTCLAFADAGDHITVSDMELRREGKSYSFDTVTALKDDETALFLYCGTDMLLGFDRWYRFRDILSMVTIAYAGREVQDDVLRCRVEEKMRFLREECGAEILTIPLSPIATSSTEIRERIAKGEDASDLLPPSVYEHIKKMRLYRNDTAT